MRKYLFSMILFFIINSLLAQTSTEPSNYGISTGLSGDPYFISSLDNLYWLSQTSADWDKYYEQTVDIDASDTDSWDDNGFGGYFGFSPIGNDATKFTGSYNGDGYEIDGLTIMRYSPNPYDNIGLFGSIGVGGAPANVQNLGVTNVNIQGSINVGGLIGATDWGSTVIDCYSTGTITNSYLNVGGLVGLNDGSTITNCYSTVSVTGQTRVGGLVGYNYFNATIQRSCSIGDVVANSWAGGLVGQSSGATTTRIRDCYSTGDVRRTLGMGTSTFGGFCGQNDLIINRCYSTGRVVYAGVENPTDAGFVGFNSSGTYNNNFFDSVSSFQTTGTGATAKTTVEMKDVATFTSTATVGLDAPWDFVTDPYDDVGTNDWWDMDPTPAQAKTRSLAKVTAIDDGYPFLGWQNGEDTALPVELSLFTVEATIQGVLCNWTTESEIENIGFVLERKTEGTNWIEIASYKTDNSLMGQGTTPSYTNYEFLDMLVEPNTTYEYRLADVDQNGVVTYHATRTVTVGNTVQSSLIEKFTVLPAYPNPFNPSTTIRYGLAVEGTGRDLSVQVNIYDITGKLITTLFNGEQMPGWHSVIWNGTNQNSKLVPAGLYFSKITSGSDVKTTKLMLLK